MQKFRAKQAGLVVVFKAKAVDTGFEVTIGAQVPYDHRCTLVLTADPESPSYKGSKKSTFLFWFVVKNP